MARFYLIVLSSLFSVFASASSCCGQTPASYPVLYLQEKFSVVQSITQTQSMGRVFEGPDFYVWPTNKKRIIQIAQWQVATTLSERQQLFMVSGVSRGEFRDSQQNASETHCNDTLIGYNYELLPEYSYSWWKPLIYLSALINLPTGNSIYDPSGLAEGTGVTGHNQWGTGAGMTIRKVYFPWTWTLQFKSLYLFSRSFETLNVSSFYDHSAALFLNYALGIQDIQILTGVTSAHLSPRSISTSSASSGWQRNTTWILGLQKAMTENIFLGGSYSDQTLLGPAANTLLNRSFTLNINYNIY